MWAIVKKALNSTVGAKMKPLDDIVEEKLYEKYYNDCLMKSSDAVSSFAYYMIPNGTTIATTPPVLSYSELGSIQRIIFPVTVKEISGNAFIDCSNVRDIILPPRLKTIGFRAFYGSYKTTQITFPKSIDKIESGSFSNCPSLETVVFKGTPNSIAADSFSGCDKLTDIYVPWSEDDKPEYVYLPGGAMSATIHYNSEV